MKPMQESEEFEVSDVDLENQEADLSAKKVEKKNQYTRSDPGTRLIGMLTMLVLLVSGVVISVFVYNNARQSERNEFELRFNDQSKHVIHALKAEAASKLRALDAFAIDVTANMIGSNGTWPMVTVPMFEYRAASTLTIARALTLNLVPLVRDEKRSDWENYSVEQSAWRSDGLVFQEKFPDATSPKMMHHRRELLESMDNSTEFGIDDKIFTVSDGERTQELTHPMYFPLWQQYPVHEHRPWVNYNIGTDPKYVNDIKALMSSKEAVFSRFWYLEDSMQGLYISPLADSVETMDHGAMDETMDHGGMVGDRLLQEMGHEDEMGHGDEMANGGGHMAHGSKDRFTGPANTIYYPFFDSHDPSIRQVTGFLTSSVSWESFFTASLPPDPNGITPVIENSCGQVFTFQIIGNSVNYLGPEDLHEMEYADMVRSATLTNDGDSFTAIPLNADHCQVSVRVYPSKRMEEDYRTNDPLIYALFVGGIFVFSVVLFIVYEMLAKRRQRYLAEHANKNHAIVSSLFPEVVRDRLFEEQEEKQEKKDIFAADMAQVSGCHDTTGTPIADLFPECSVLFADLVGFTKWSSSRSPSEVFTLLEKLFGSFDGMARRYKIFKVETIGDCYLCATGLPEPQSDHATRMIRFASACLRSMNVVLRELQHTLGPECIDLQLRIGIHSGPVTAGVLRGEKSRFQLFGDTVNTASRMESNGSPNRIQVSEQTAAELTNAGKGSWLIPRAELVQAKGKGAVQTFWVHEKDGKSVADTSVAISESDCREDPSVSGLADGSCHSFKPISDNDDLEDLSSRLADRLKLYR